MGGACQSKSKVRAEAKPTHLLDVLTDHEGGVNTMALSYDEAILATGSDDHTVRLWTTVTDVCECIGVLIGHDDYINCVVIEDVYVLSGSADKTIRKWDMATCSCVAVLEGHESTVNRLICTGDFIFSSSYDQYMCSLCRSNHHVPKHSNTPHTLSLCALMSNWRYINISTYSFSSSYDRTARCWDFESCEFVREFRGHRRSVYPLIFIPAPDDDDKEDGVVIEWTKPR